MGKRQERYFGADISPQLTANAGKQVQLELITGGVLRVRVIKLSEGKLHCHDFTPKPKQIQLTDIFSLVIDQEAPY